MVLQTREATPVPGWISKLRSADALYVTDERQQLVVWSPSAERVLGYAAEEVLGRPCHAVVAGVTMTGHPVCRPDCPVVVNARRGRVTAPYDVLARRRDGGRVWLNSGVALVPAEQGCATLMLHLSRELRGAPPAARQAGTLERTRPARAAAPATPLSEPLSRREIEVLRLLVARKSTAEIADALTVSRFTVRNHLGNIQRKLGARNRVETLLLASTHGLV